MSEQEQNTTLKEVITGEAQVKDMSIDQLNDALSRVNQTLERYTNNADKIDYAFAVASGVLAGAIDSLFVGEFSLEHANQCGTDKVEKIVIRIARFQGYKKDDLYGAVKYVEKNFPIAADKLTDKFGGGLQHHLRDFSHHASLVGLYFSMLTQFTGKVYGTDDKGMFICKALNEEGLALIGQTFPQKIAFGMSHWFFHLVSDVAGSSSSILKGSAGTGIPGPILSLVKELSALPFFQKKDKKAVNEVSVMISKLFNGTLLGKRDAKGRLSPLKFDFRTEIGIAHQIGKQMIPVILNDCLVRVFFTIRRFGRELSSNGQASLQDISWEKIMPIHHRTLDRMIVIASITFTVADTADAVIRAAVESGGNWVLFSGRFVTRFNYVGGGRAAFAVVREVSNERKEAQLLHEKRILSEAKAVLFLKKLQDFKDQLDVTVSHYLAEDIKTMMSGFEEIQQGVSSGDANLVIKGNITIQKVLGRTPQFTNQTEFDSLMDADTPLVL